MSSYTADTEDRVFFHPRKPAETPEETCFFPMKSALKWQRTAARTPLVGGDSQSGPSLIQYELRLPQ